MIATVVLSTTPALAQWDVFPLGQRSYYKDLSQADTQVDLVMFDSLRVEPGTGTWWLNRTGIHREVFGTCAPGVMNYMSAYYQPMGMPTPMDSLLERNDTLFYFHPSSINPFFFLPKAYVGQSWTVSSTFAGNMFSDIAITCTSIAEGTVLGVADSIKTYSLQSIGSSSLFDNLQIRLSKHHGLIDYVPFESFLYRPNWATIKWYELMGMEVNGAYHSYRQPGFHDYFHLSPGDVLFWRTDEHPWDISAPSLITYRLDSIVDVLITPDSVVYTCNSTEQGPQGDLVEYQGTFWRFRKAMLQGMLDAAPNDLALGNGAEFVNTSTTVIFVERPIWFSGPLQLEVIPDTGDTITSYGFNAFEPYLDSACVIREFSDWSYEWRFDTRAGVTKYCANFGMGTNCTVLIASRINGQTMGDITLAMGEMRRGGGGPSMHPNPASDRLFLDGTWHSGTPYSIIDGQGRMVLQGTLRQDGIDVQELSPGIHVLLLETAQGRSAVRFVKE